MLDIIRQSWSWTGLEPAEIIAQNQFGNVIVRATDGAYWRICPEELSCKVIARDNSEYAALWASEDFQIDWQMLRLVELVVAKLGPVTDQDCYCLKMPAVLGGRYEEENLGVIRRRELIAFAGDIAEQIKGLPDGTKIELRITD